MRLSHITLHGFKSFAKKTTLDVTHQVTGVVGPNGSGKSNVAEAIRFVLGEQSMKSMRGKQGADLIFKGSHMLPGMSRASVTMVIDNRDKHTNVATHHASDELAPYLVYDELVLSRVIYADGTSDYTLNDAKVRLKDVQELLAFAGIGGSAHTIINQGEADRILLASPKERKEALEDALGLRVYHIRLNESRRKLEKVKIHVHEVELLRKEIAPHLLHLKRQVEKLESKEQERILLGNLLVAYFNREEHDIALRVEKIREAGSSVSLSLITDSIKKELAIYQSSNRDVHTVSRNEKQTLQAELRSLLERKEQITKTIGRLEAEKGYLVRELNQDDVRKDVVIPRDAFVEAGTTFTSGINSLKKALDIWDATLAKTHTESLSSHADAFFAQAGSQTDEDKKEKLRSSIARANDEIQEHEQKERGLKSDIEALQEKIDTLDSVAQNTLISLHEEEKKKMLLESKLRELESTIALRKQEEAEVAMRKERFDALLSEGAVIVGREILGYKETAVHDVYKTLPMTDLMRAIERSKIKIEEAGIPNAAEVREEYRLTVEREQYLSKELADIKETEGKLLALIDDLSVQLKERFASGVEHVSKSFSDFFAEVFDGGKAKLTLMDIIKVDEDGEQTKEQGVDIEVKLPSKKVQELAMFSGGERALTSIALLFAMSSLTPPPFMVLDETDAPLDEHNARKYGHMLGRLAEKSKLLVITHNRETMNHCDMLYGVTIGAEGASKLLSINFKDVAHVA